MRGKRKSTLHLYLPSKWCCQLEDVTDAELPTTAKFSLQRTTLIVVGEYDQHGGNNRKLAIYEQMLSIQNVIEISKNAPWPCKLVIKMTKKISCGNSTTSIWIAIITSESPKTKNKINNINSDMIIRKINKSAIGRMALK